MFNNQKSKYYETDYCKGSYNVFPRFLRESILTHKDKASGNADDA